MEPFVLLPCFPWSTVNFPQFEANPCYQANFALAFSLVFVGISAVLGLGTRIYHLSFCTQLFPEKYLNEGSFLLTVGAFLLTVKLLCLQSLKALIRRTVSKKAPIVSKKAKAVSEKAKAVSEKAPTVSKKAKIVNCK